MRLHLVHIHLCLAVPEPAGPAEGEGSTAFWNYHSHVDEVKTSTRADRSARYHAPRHGSSRRLASDVDREVVAQFGLFDEHLSWYWDTNLKRLYGDPKNYHGHDTRIHDFHHFFTINGYLDGNDPC